MTCDKLRAQDLIMDHYEEVMVTWLVLRVHLQGGFLRLDCLRTNHDSSTDDSLFLAPSRSPKNENCLRTQVFRSGEVIYDSGRCHREVTS